MEYIKVMKLPSVGTLKPLNVKPLNDLFFVTSIPEAEHEMEVNHIAGYYCGNDRYCQLLFY